jgi:uncharacterized SAM-dependent methyltransferase
MLRFGDGEEMLTEISAKFCRYRLRAELAAAGLELAAWWTDAAGDATGSATSQPPLARRKRRTDGYPR